MKRILNNTRLFLVVLFLLLFNGLSCVTAVEIEYLYDDLNRLKAVLLGDTVTTYNYDEVGNILSKKTMSIISTNIITPYVALKQPGSDHNISIIATLEDGTALNLAPLAIYSKSSNECVAKASPSGRVEIAGAGLASITVSYRGISKNVEFDIVGSPAMTYSDPKYPVTNPVIFIEGGDILPGFRFNLSRFAYGSYITHLTMGEFPINNPFVVKCGAIAVLKAKNSIALKPGFIAEKGSTFSASIW